MILKPWYTSSDIISAVKRKIALPTFQGTFSDGDILDFANEVLKEEQVPMIMRYHEEYFTNNVLVTLQPNKSRYTIPERAIGTKLRDLHYQDPNGNLLEMVAVNPDERSFYQQSNYSNSSLVHYYLEGNDIVLIPTVTNSAPDGYLLFSIYQRPNLLVEESRAAIITSFGKQITINIATLVAGQTFIITQSGVNTIFTAVNGAPSANQFQIGVDSPTTASNLASAINVNGIASASVSTNVLTLTYSDRNITCSAINTSAFVISSNLMMNCAAGIPTNITTGSYIDIMQTKSAHKVYTTSYLIPSGGISTNSFILLDSAMSTELIVGDYIALQYESIIPQIPTDMHSVLAERTSGRILAAQGDTQGLQVTNAKIGELKDAESAFLENRTEGTPKKVTARHSLLRYSKNGYYRSRG